MSINHLAISFFISKCAILFFGKMRFITKSENRIKEKLFNERKK
jgi:hypothetical protein